jgi:hypothetical protein
MAITTASQSQIGQDTAKNSQVVTTVVKNFTSGTLGSGGPSISSIVVTDSGYNNLDDTAVETSNSFIKIIGTGFANGANVFINGTQVPAANVTFTSSSELRVRLPVLVNNTNNVISIFNTNLSGALSANALLSQTTFISYLIVAGGGSGGAGGNAGLDNRGGGGGAGGILNGSTPLVGFARNTYTITIGSGGAYGSSGNNTTLGNLFTAIGGGRGGIGNEAGQPGGSGGGGGAFRTAGNFAGGSGTVGQGNDGGVGGTDSVTYRYGAGGGGAGAAGTNAFAGPVPGGVGIQSSISGTATYYGGGGAGGGSNSSGGLGGGGPAPSVSGAGGVAGTANTGGGGGGASAFTGSNGGAGGSGILIISYPGTQRMTGGNVTTSGANTIHTFTSSGTLTY